MTDQTRRTYLKGWKRARILDLLSQGLGVEDIAVITKWRADAIRQFVFSMPPKSRREIYARQEASE